MAADQIQSILAALAAQGSGTPQTPQQQPQPQPGPYQGYPGAPQSAPPNNAQAYGLPQPTHSGSFDISALKPSNTGSVSIADAIAKARGIAAEKGIAYEGGGGRSSAGPSHDPRGGYQRPRSRSPPGRRDSYRDNYNPYRDERRDDRRGGGYGRDRSRSPGPRGRGMYSPQPNRGGYGRDRSPQGDDSETIVIDRHLVGLVIGRQGENLRRVERDTGCRIQFLTGPESSGPHRHCRITGEPRARMDAKREINRIIDENGGNPIQDIVGNRSATVVSPRPPKPSATNLREGENSIQIMVPDRTVGLIIGRGGETIRDLQERSGCHVNIVGENKSVNGLRPVNLIGTEAAASKAKELIMEVVESDTKTMGNREQRSQDHFGGGGGGGGVSSGGGGMSHDSGKITEHILVPSEAVGMIIGKGGETIRDMQTSTSCKINVSQASGADIERDIELVGTSIAIERATAAIWEKVDAVKDKNSGGYGGGGGGNRRGARDDYQDRYSQAQQPSYDYSQQSNQQAAPTGGSDSAADPYAQYGGYQNYVALWYAAMAQQGQGQASGEQQNPPGA